MVQFVLIMSMLLSFQGHAQLIGVEGEKNSFPSRIPELLEKLKSIEMKADPFYEEDFNQKTKNIENVMEIEKLYCSGEALDKDGHSILAEKKQLCMRELKKQYLDAMGVMFELKKKYLALIHTRQLERLGEIHAKLRANIEKNF
jgi:hypothetical protein